jgi:hypothetical protein
MSAHEEGWNRMQAIEFAPGNLRTRHTLAEALAPVEYGYYFVIFYTILGAPLGLILTGGIGSGFLLIPVLALCCVAMGASILTVLRTIWIPIACGASYLFIQLAVHGESLYGAYVYTFGPWLISVVIVQALAVHRPNFLHRFAWFTLFMGLAMLQFTSLGQTKEYGRMGLEGAGYGNPNALAAWFGFCVVYLTIRGYCETSPAHRLPAWIMALGSLYVVTLTVSRTALIAAGASLLVSSRRLLKLGLLPLLFLAGLVVVLAQLGVFDQAIHSYTIRAEEETGRLQVWPLLIEKFINSPYIGYGASQAGLVIGSKFRTPHNSFLLIAVASGAIPLVLFGAYCVQSARAALGANASNQDYTLYLPLVVYTVLVTSAGNLDFMTPWAIVSLAMPLASSVSRMDGDDARVT